MTFSTVWADILASLHGDRRPGVGCVSACDWQARRPAAPPMATEIAACAKAAAVAQRTPPSPGQATYGAEASARAAYLPHMHGLRPDKGIGSVRADQGHPDRPLRSVP